MAPIAMTIHTHIGVAGGGAGGSGGGGGTGSFSVRKENTGLQSLGTGKLALTCQ